MANLPLSISVNWKPIVIGFLVLVGVLYYFSGYHWKPHEELPVKRMLKNHYLKVNGVEKGIFYRHAAPGKPLSKVLFLHGRMFSSKNWEDIGTLEFLAKKNYEVLALDLPAFGNSKLEAPKNSSDKAKLLGKIIKDLNYENSVLVVPSMSGGYALPFIFEEENYKKLRAFVPIAPVGTEEFKDDQFKNLNLKTLIIFGQDDKLTFVAKAIGKLKLIPGATVKRIDQAGHACYIDKPDYFHTYLEDFLKTL